MADVTRRGFVGAMGMMGAVSALGAIVPQIVFADEGEEKLEAANTLGAAADGTVVPLPYVKMRALIHTYGMCDWALNS